MKNPCGRSFIVDSEDPEHWAEAIKGIRQKGSEAAIKECRELRTRYAKKYSWETQSTSLVRMMLTKVHGECWNIFCRCLLNKNPRPSTLVSLHSV